MKGTQVLLSAKLRNMIINRNKWNEQLNLEFYLKNIIVNGVKRGCSGFVVNTDNNLCVYVNTEKSVYGPLHNKVLYRYADNIKDYTGYRNHYCEEDKIAECILGLLKQKVESCL